MACELAADKSHENILVLFTRIVRSNISGFILGLPVIDTRDTEEEGEKLNYREWMQRNSEAKSEAETWKNDLTQELYSWFDQRLIEKKDVYDIHIMCNIGS